MTGRKLYDNFCDARSSHSSWDTPGEQLPKTPVSWPFLHWRDRACWNDLARRITPKPRKVSA